MTLNIPEPLDWNRISPRGQRLFRYVGSLLLVAVATGLCTLVTPDFTPTNLIMIYLLAVVVAAVYLGRGPAILASITGVLAFDYLFIPPYFTLTVADSEYLLSMAGFLLVGVVISYLAARAREEAEAARRHAAEISSLYALSRDLATADGLEAILATVSAHAARTFGWEINLLLPKNGVLAPHDPLLHPLSQEDLKAATWAYENGEPSGKGTERFHTAWVRYLPLKTSLHTVGVLGARTAHPTGALARDQLRLLETFAGQAALAIEHGQLADQARQVKLLQSTEQLQHALLNSISHDLRTPLVSITGALSTLDEQDETLSEESRRSLVETAREEADRLNRLVGNLLDMTRLEAGALRLHREPADIQDLVGAALGQIEERLGDRQVHIDMPPDLPLVPLDFVLIVRVLVNLVDNAIKYSPHDTRMDIQVRLHEGELYLSILDRGLGVPEGDLSRIFDKFFRVHHPEQITGTGLGLAISKGIVEAHEGRIWAENRPGGGTIITVALPAGTRK